MKRFDVFNGDADGICALHQLRLAEPAKASLVTGVKRDVGLLAGLGKVRGAQVTVLDLPFHENREAALGLLERDCRLLYFDHHFAGEVPSHPGLESHIHPSPTTCTSLLVDDYLQGAFRVWAVTGAFGDNLVHIAPRVAAGLDLTAQELGGLRTLGELINYNSYGETLEDLHIPPAKLYGAILPYDDPLDFLTRAPEADALQAGFSEDMARAEAAEPILEGESGRVFRFSAEVWARRVMGIFANRAAQEDQNRATALIVDNSDGTIRVSVRAPMAFPQGADALCRAFPTGGGRDGAAGITAMPESDLPRFLEAFRAAWED